MIDTDCTDELLAGLPPVVATTVHAAKAVLAAQKYPSWGELADAMEPAREAVGLPPHSYGNVVYPLASELTPDQRALAEIVAREGLALRANVPSGDALGRWLGVTPPGVLEKTIDGEPLWRALQRAGGDETKVLTLLDPMPFGLQIEACAAISGPGWAYRIPPAPRLAWRTKMARELGDEGKGWALETLGAWRPRPDGSLALAPGVTNLAFFALVRAKAAIDPAWDVLVPLDHEVPVAFVVECALALPFERLEPAVLAALTKVAGAWAIQHGTALLEHFDSGPIARLVLTITEKSLPRDRKAERAALETIGTRMPNVAAELAAARGKAPKPRVLTMLARTTPRTENELTPTQAEQLVAAGKLYDGKSLAVTQRLTIGEADEGALGETLEHVVIGDEKRKPVIDAWLYAGDSGTYFSAGTTKVVAQKIQDAIEVRGKPDAALCDALASVSGAEAEKNEAPTRKKKPAPAKKKR